MSSIYFNVQLLDKICIKPSEINKADIDTLIANKIKNKIGNKCNKHGLVNKDSITILNRSAGMIASEYFSGDIIFNVKYSAQICNPNEGLVINCQIKSKTKMGLLGSIGSDINSSPLLILLAKQHHINNNEFSKINIGDKVSIKIIGKKFEVNDTQIVVVARLSNSSSTTTMHGGKSIVSSNDLSDKLSREDEIVLLSNYLDGNIVDDLSDHLQVISSDIKQKYPNFSKFATKDKRNIIDFQLQFNYIRENLIEEYGNEWDSLSDEHKEKLINENIDNTKKINPTIPVQTKHITKNTHIYNDSDEEDDDDNDNDDDNDDNDDDQNDNIYGENDDVQIDSDLDGFDENEELTEISMSEINDNE